MKQLVIVFIGGGAGSIGRYLIGKWLNNTNYSIPLGTLAANIVGSLLIGLILGWALKNNALNSNTTLLLATGFCGGFTTFSTFSFEMQSLLKNGDMLPFALYAMGSVVAGLIAVFIGIWLMKTI